MYSLYQIAILVQLYLGLEVAVMAAEEEIAVAENNRIYGHIIR
jgi:hypothetical protein